MQGRWPCAHPLTVFLTLEHIYSFYIIFKALYNPTSSSVVLPISLFFLILFCIYTVVVIASCIMLCVKRKYPCVDSHHMEDGSEHDNANHQNEEPTDVGLLQHLWALSPQGGLSTWSAGWNSILLRRSEAARSVSSVYPSPMASWSFPVADTGMDCTHLSAGKDPILSPRRRQEQIY